MSIFATELELRRLVSSHVHLKTVFLRENSIHIFQLLLVLILKITQHLVKTQLLLILNTMQTEIGVHFGNECRFAILNEQCVREYHLTTFDSIGIRQQMLNKPSKVSFETAKLLINLFPLKNRQAKFELLWHLMKVTVLFFFFGLKLAD